MSGNTLCWLDWKGVSSPVPLNSPVQWHMLTFPQQCFFTGLQYDSLKCFDRTEMHLPRVLIEPSLGYGMFSKVMFECCQENQFQDAVHGFL